MSCATYGTLKTLHHHQPSFDPVSAWPVWVESLFPCCFAVSTSAGIPPQFMEPFSGGPFAFPGGKWWGCGQEYNLCGKTMTILRKPHYKFSHSSSSPCNRRSSFFACFSYFMDWRGISTTFLTTTTGDWTRKEELLVLRFTLFLSRSVLHNLPSLIMNFTPAVHMWLVLNFPEVIREMWEDRGGSKVRVLGVIMMFAWINSHYLYLGVILEL